MDNFKRFYIFTGKGGVGKTTLSLSFCKFLESQNKKYLYAYLDNSNIDKESHKDEVINNLLTKFNISSLGLDLVSCAKGYMAKKLGSETVASWISKTPFFRSLINMIPGFSYVIYLGQLLELLEADPNLIIVLDSPSSGHALTMLESTKNFSEIFQSGPIYDDTQKMISYLTSSDFLKINIISLPTLLAIHEGKELTTELSKIHNFNIQTHVNHSLKSFANDKLPKFLKKKIQNEQTAIEAENISSTIPFILNSDQGQILKDLLPSIESLV